MLPIRMDEPQERGTAMIELTRLNGTPMVLNSDLIKTAEAYPDTMLTLIHGEKLIVRESTDEVMKRVIAYRALLLTNVALRLHPFTEVQKVVSLASLDLSEDPSPVAMPGRNSDPEADR
jgi:flagellar protein FlbD